MSPTPERVRKPVGAAPLAATTARMPDFWRGPSAGEACRQLAPVALAVAGCGSGGLRAIDTAARMGFRELLCVDPAVFKPESLLTHPLITASAVGRAKARFAAQHAVRVNPGMTVRYHVGEMESVGLDVLQRYHAILVFTDTIDSELSLGLRARQAGKIYMRAAVDGRMGGAQVTVLGNTDGSACPGCLLGPSELAAVGKGRRFSCSGESIPSHEAPMPTRVIPSLAGMAADLVVQQLVRQLILGAPVTDTQVTYCGDSNRILTGTLKRSSQCTGDHRAYTPVVAASALRSMTLAATVHASGLEGDEGLSMEVEGYRFAAKAICPCGKAETAGRFLQTAGRGVRVLCPGCGTTLAGDFTTHRTVTPNLLGERGMSTPLGRLGAGAATCVIVRSSSRGAPVLSKRGGQS